MVNVKKIEGLLRSERLEKCPLQKIVWWWCFGVWEIWRHNNRTNFFFGGSHENDSAPKWFLMNRGWSFYPNFEEVKWVTQNIQNDENGWVLQTEWPPNDLSEPRKSKRKTWIPLVMSNVPCWCCDSQAKYCFTCPESTTSTLDCTYAIKSKQRTTTRQLQRQNVGSPDLGLRIWLRALVHLNPIPIKNQTAWLVKWVPWWGHNHRQEGSRNLPKKARQPGPPFFLNCSFRV